VIVEGYLDVIALHQAGYTNTVSPMGTALTDQQLYLLKRFSHRIVLALDPDAAGIQATLRGLEIARQTMDRAQDPVFDARGLLGYEARLQADIRVTTLPQGMDPDDVVNQDPTQWESILSNAQPIVIHVMNTLAATQDTDDPKIKNDIASRVIPLIQDVPNPVERDTYLQKLSRLLRIDERTLLGWLPAQSRRRPTRRFIPDRSSQKADRSITISKVSASSITQEAYALGVLLRRPELLYQVDRNLQKYGLPRLSADDFQHTDHQAIITLLIESIDQDAAEPLNFVMNHLSLSMMEVADALLMGTEKLDPNEEKIADDIKRIVLSLRQRNVHQAIEYQRFLMEDAHQQGDIKGTQYQKNMVQLTSIKAKIDRALGKHS
jgi:DNA primase